MKAVQNRNSRDWLVWLCSSCIVLAALASLFRFFPTLPPGRRAPEPFVPRIRFIAGAHDDHARELRAVLSPALITLPSGIVHPHPAFDENRVDRVTPPIGALDPPAMFLRRMPDPAAESHADPHPSDRHRLSAALRVPPREGAPVFKEPHRDGGIGLKFSGGLENAPVDWPRFPDEWTAQDAPWSLTIHIRFDGKGFPVNVFLERPSRHDVLNERAVRMAYLARLAGPDAPREGRVTIYGFPGIQ